MTNLQGGIWREHSSYRLNQKNTPIPAQYFLQHKVNHFMGQDIPTFLKPFMHHNSFSIIFSVEYAFHFILKKNVLNNLALRVQVKVLTWPSA